jgi:hypothetical protein
LFERDPKGKDDVDAYKWDHGAYEIRDALKTIRTGDLGINKFSAYRKVFET